MVSLKNDISILYAIWNFIHSIKLLLVRGTVGQHRSEATGLFRGRYPGGDRESAPHEQAVAEHGDGAAAQIMLEKRLSAANCGGRFSRSGQSVSTFILLRQSALISARFSSRPVVAAINGGCRRSRHGFTVRPWCLFGLSLSQPRSTPCDTKAWLGDEDSNLD